MYENTSQLKAAHVERDSSEIEGCLSRASDALERLHSRVAAMEDRLRAVMRATGSGVQGAAGVPKEALSPLGDAIRSMEDRIDSACERLEAMLNGLAL